MCVCVRANHKSERADAAVIGFYWENISANINIDLGILFPFRLLLPGARARTALEIGQSDHNHITRTCNKHRYGGWLLGRAHAAPFALNGAEWMPNGIACALTRPLNDRH